MKYETFKVTNSETGQEVTCNIIFTFDSDETGNSYMVYTDNSLDEEGNVQVFASIYDPNDEQPVLQPIETEKEWVVIESILEGLQEDLNRKKDEVTEQ